MGVRVRPAFDDEVEADAVEAAAHFESVDVAEVANAWTPAVSMLSARAVQLELVSKQRTNGATEKRTFDVDVAFGPESSQARVCVTAPPPPLLLLLVLVRHLLSCSSY